MSKRNGRSGRKRAGCVSRRSFLEQSAVGMAALALGPHAAIHALTTKALTTRADSSPFLLAGSGGTVSSLRFRGDRFPTDYIEPGQRIGDIGIAWRRPDGAWQRLETQATGVVAVQGIAAKRGGYAARYVTGDSAGNALEAEVRLEPHGDDLRWAVRLRNLSTGPIEVGDLRLPLPMHTLFKGDGPPTASVLKHSFISGSGSFLFWMRSNSVGPYLLMVPEPTTALEFWDRTRETKTTPAVYRVYLHSMAEGEAVAAAGGRWRQPHTSLQLAPQGSHSDEREYAFRLSWQASYADVQRSVAQAGLLDVEVAPGMTLPTDLFCCVAFRTSNPVATIVAEYPDETKIEPLVGTGHYQQYRVHFARLGENLLTVRQADGRLTRLEFFATEPLETLIHKRGAFIAGHQQRDPAKWYNGLLSEWNMDSEVMLSPDNYDRIKGWRIYEVTCDDPGLSKPAFLASKLAEYPEQRQVDAMEDYIQHFVWGGLQRTTEESDSYGIYGILDWKRNRDSPDPGDKGQRHMWRPYDYPHVIVMYWGMYRVARDFPGIHTRLSRATYLERTYQTAMALFTVPRRIINWEAYQTGFYNECVIPAIIDELELAGEKEKAAALRMEWEKKVQYFLAGGANLFGSEYAFDSTGFESTQAIARYALDRNAVPGTTADQVKTFAQVQMQANLFCRGMVEKSYYYYGSDYRAEGGDAYVLSYMAQMGGWAVLDHALHDGLVPDATVRLGYASYLSAWALMNTGTAESNFGYWYPGAANDGGAGGGFEPAAHSSTWLGQPNHRGSWYYSSEEDLGFCGALRCAATVVADDPIFGRFCFGGLLRQEGDVLHIAPKDGVRRRLNLRTLKSRIDLEVVGARFGEGFSVRWSPGLDRFDLLLEREATSSGQALLIVRGLQGETYRLTNGETSLVPTNQGMLRIRVTLPAVTGKIELHRL